ncbi:MAG: M3 family oligoendopeptidase [Spirochaetaceae bacterium]|nr:MAG: M3 family oligoendopeptidase [Spirochaetaceae bacterium]
MRTATGPGSDKSTVSTVPAPRWQLDRIYPGFDSAPFQADLQRLSDELAQLHHTVEDQLELERDPVRWLERCIVLINSVVDCHENLDAYAYARYSTDTGDQQATRELNRIQQLSLPLHRLRVRFREQLMPVSGQLDAMAGASGSIRAHRFHLNEQLEECRHQMSVAEEDLAADLARSGADAWSRLQEAISSQLEVAWKPGETRTVVDLRAMAHLPDRDLRRRAYELEIDAWRSMQVPLSYALNGVKGHSVILNARRGYADPLERAAFQSRVSRSALETMITVIERSLPLFRTYLKAKARVLGLPQLAFYDLFAPVTDAVNTRRWSFAEAAAFIIEQFAGFSQELADLAARAFDDHWIDAQPRAGKVGGAYCISLPLAGQSRILASFDGSFSSVCTLAHELGHAYHYHVLKGAPALQRVYPMTLAETASIFCETIVLDRTLDHSTESDRIPVIELFLQDATQVIVDILSRFYFERQLFARRGQAELSPAELCRMMSDAQQATYGDALDSDALHPYMWAVKGHYYRHDQSFYNFPYAFGLLFGLGLFARYRAHPTTFPGTYREILAATGSASAAEVTKAAGFDIEDPAFWGSAIDMIAARIDQFCSTGR